MKLVLKSWIGALLNRFGVPGFVRYTIYSNPAAGVRVLVQCYRLFSVISVNGVDVYFHRITGKIDGVFVNPNANRGMLRTTKSYRLNDARAASVVDSGRS